MEKNGKKRPGKKNKNIQVKREKEKVERGERERQYVLANNPEDPREVHVLGIEVQPQGIQHLQGHAVDRLKPTYLCLFNVVFNNKN